MSRTLSNEEKAPQPPKRAVQNGRPLERSDGEQPDPDQEYAVLVAGPQTGQKQAQDAGEPMDTSDPQRGNRERKA